MGESSGETGWNNVQVSRGPLVDLALLDSQRLSQEEIDDLKHLLSHVRTSNSAPLNRIAAIIGHSKGAVVVLSLASDASFLSALNGASSPPPLIISLSARYDTSSLSPSGLSRFNDEQKAALERDGRFVWLRYRAGPEPERPERREYVVTKEAVESAKRRTLECVESIPRGTQVLLLHGRADGTVPTIETGKVDARIRDHGEASSDVVLVEGVEHNWDGEGELEAAAEWIEVWMKARTKRPANRVLEADLVDHLGLNRRK